MNHPLHIYMARNYATIAFTDAVKDLQTQLGSRRNYARMEELTYYEGLTESEQEFISQRDSFYMATVGSNGYPYVQFRGGPKGFLKVLDAYTLGFLDFKGNMQYISTGNLQTNRKAALIFMDYAQRARLKLFAAVEIVALGERPELEEQLLLPGYKARAERAMLLKVEAYDWNCPQHITPRYTIEEIEPVLSSYKTRIEELEKELKKYETKKDDESCEWC